MLNIGYIVFQNPYALFLLVILPFLWKFLKTSPLLPTLLKFPAIILISNKKSIDNTPEKNSTFILLLRISIFIILIIILSKPNLGKVSNSQLQQLIIIDNSWISSINWEERKNKIKELIKPYTSSNFNFTILSTTHHSDKDILTIKSNNYEELKEYLNNLQPLPWQPNYEFLNKFIQENNTKFDSIFWFTENVINDEKKKLYEFLKKENLFIYSDLTNNLPPILRLKKQNNEMFEFEISHFDENFSSGYIHAYDENRRLLYRFNYNEKSKNKNTFLKTNVKLLLPLYLKNKVNFFQLNSIRTASSIVYLSKWERNKLVGLSTLNSNKKIQQLDKGNYYVKKSLEKNYSIIEDTMENLIDKSLKIIYVDDSYVIQKKLEKKILDWIKDGGVLVKLGGEKLIRELKLGNENFFDFSFSLLKQSSNLGENLSLKKFLKIRKFDNKSPFFGINVPEEIKVKKYIQRNVEQRSEKIKSFASLENGATLISSKNFGKGKMIFFHIPCSLDWSNLCLSYLFVDLNERIVNSIKGFKKKEKRILKPYLAVDGFGDLKNPNPESLNIIKLQNQNLFNINYDQPPGLYKDSFGIFALNLSDSINYNFDQFEFEEKVFAMDKLNYQNSNFQNFLIILICFLFILENFIVMINKDVVNFNMKKLFCYLFFILLISRDSIALDKSIFNLVSNNKIGYILTKNQKINEINKNGLVSISNFITQKTAAIMGKPQPLNFNKDELYYFPLIYWSIIDENLILNENEIKKINNYTKNGGLLIVDCKTKKNNILPEDCLELFKRIFPLSFFSEFKPLNSFHTIAKSFYLLNSFPGRKDNKVFIASNESQNSDKGASIILGNNNWTDSWALKENNDFLFPLLDDTKNQRIFSFRFGLNLLIHSLTGNYKTDQVHIPEILKRIKD